MDFSSSCCQGINKICIIRAKQGRLKTLLLFTSSLPCSSSLLVPRASLAWNSSIRVWKLDTAGLFVTTAHHRTWRQLRLKWKIVGKKSELKSFPLPPIHVSGIARTYSTEQLLVVFFKNLNNRCKFCKKRGLFLCQRLRWLSLVKLEQLLENMSFLGILLYLA